MKKSICLCLLIVTLQLVSGFSKYDIFAMSGHWFSSIFKGFQSEINRRASEPISDEYVRLDQWDDTLCLEQLNTIWNGLNSSEPWAYKMIDSWGKIPSGILSGNTYELGQFDECVSIVKPANNQDLHALKAQYCLARISFESNVETAVFPKETYQYDVEGQIKGVPRNLMPNQETEAFGLNIGICVPESCSPTRLAEIINYVFKTSNVSAAAFVSRDLCQTNSKGDLNTLDIFTISFFSIIGLLMVASTIYDLMMTRYGKNKRIGLTAFSIYSNTQKIFDCKKNSSPYAIDCLNGIRVLSLFWVIWGHAHLTFAIGPVINAAYVAEWLTQVYSMIFVSATISVDSFFLLSGLLVAWATLRHLNKSNGKMNIFLFYFHRILRLTPSLAALVLLSSSLINHFGSGPLWDSYMKMFLLPCENYWWSTLLYVQNYVHPTEMCLGHSWYLAVDTQLFILSPLIVYPLWRWRQKFVWVIPILIAASMGYVFTTYMINHYSVKIPAHFVQRGIMEKTYSCTHCRMGAWLVGVLLGYILHNFHGKSIKIPKIFIAIGWSVAIGTILSIIFGEYFLQQSDYVPTDLESAFYESFSRVCWAISLSWIIFACCHGYAGAVNWFLSLPQWQPLAKLSYSVYLLHFPIQILLTASRRVHSNFDNVAVIHRFWGDFGLALTASLFWTVAFESPIIVLEKVLFSKRNGEVVTVAREDLVKNESCSVEAIPTGEANDTQEQSSSKCNV